MHQIVSPMYELPLNIDADPYFHFWNILDPIMSLRAGFNRIYRCHDGTSITIDRDSALTSLVNAIRNRIDGFEKFKYLDGIYQVLRSIIFIHWRSDVGDEERQWFEALGWTIVYEGVYTSLSPSVVHGIWYLETEGTNFPGPHRVAVWRKFGVDWREWPR